MDKLDRLEEFARRGMSAQAAVDILTRVGAMSDEEAITDLAKSLDVDPTDIYELEVDTDGGTFKLGGSEEYRFFWDEDTAERIALAQVREDLQSEPEIFNQDWLQGHMTISETDKRIISNEEADDMVDNVLDEDQLIEKAGREDDYAAAEEVEDQALMDKIAAEAKETVREQLSDEIESQLADPVQYFVNDKGIYSVEDLMKQSFMMIDVDSAAAEAISMDGWPHFLSRYDGNYDTTERGIVYFREN